MLNLHALVRGSISALHPDETVSLRQSIGQKNVKGRIAPVYAPALTVPHRTITYSIKDCLLELFFYYIIYW